MKKVLFILLALTLSLSKGFSKDDVDYSLLKGVSTYNYSFDFSAFKINTIAAKDYVDMKLNIPYEKFSSSFQNILLSSANENMKSLSISNDEPSDVELKFLPTSADQDGEHTIMCKVVYKPTDMLILSFEINTNGGDDDKFQEELMKGLNKSGKKLAKQLEKIKILSEKSPKK